MTVSYGAPVQMARMGSTKAWGMGTCSCQLIEERMISSSSAKSSAVARPLCTRESSESGGSLRSKNLAAISRQVVAIIWMRSLQTVPLRSRVAQYRSK